MNGLKIKNIEAKEILDSRGIPTLEVKLQNDRGVFFASVPSGTSTGKREAKELRDEEGNRVSKAVRNINEVIAPKLKNKAVSEKEADQLMIELDNTKDKSHLGANAILAVSIAVCRANADNLPLYAHIAKIYGNDPQLPLPCFLMIEGGVIYG